MIRVALIDDQQLLRETLADVINQQPDMQVEWQADNGYDAVQIINQQHPNVALLDIRMEPIDGLAALKALSGQPCDTAILVLTMYDYDDYVREALRLGASGYLLKDSSPRDIIQAIRRAGAQTETTSQMPASPRELQLSASITVKLAQAFIHGTKNDHKKTQLKERSVFKKDGLTHREIEVLELIKAGLSNSEICQRLYVSPATIKTHINNLLRKTGSRDRAQLVIYAYEA